MLWVLSHLNPFVTFTKLHARVSLQPLLYITARSLRSGPSRWIGVKILAQSTTGPEAPSTSAQTAISVRQPSPAWPHTKTAFAASPFQGNSSVCMGDPGLADTPSPAWLLSWPQTNHHPDPSILHPPRDLARVSLPRRGISAGLLPLVTWQVHLWPLGPPLAL